MGLKVCRKCKVEKPLEAFGKRKAGAGGLMSQCKVCKYETIKKWRATPEGKAKDLEIGRRYRATTQGKRRAWAGDIKQKYDLDVEDWARMLNSQNCQCPACGVYMANMESRFVHVDHCHRTGRIRGLLCHFCNVALGAVREKENTLSGLIEYVRTRCA